jgi:hypothetical protein
MMNNPSPVPLARMMFYVAFYCCDLDNGMQGAPMDDMVKTLAAEGRWHVPFRDDGFWRMGIYAPEFRSPEEITVLERHTCPELFVCLRGRAGLLIRDDSGERVLELSQGEAIQVGGYHNGFIVEEGSCFLVMERTSFATEYIDRRSGDVVKKVIVG